VHPRVGMSAHTTLHMYLNVSSGGRDRAHENTVLNTFRSEVTI